VTDEGYTSTDSEFAAEITGDFAHTAGILFSGRNANDTLAKVLLTAVATLDGCDFAGIFILEGEEVTTPVQTDIVVSQVDALQRQLGEGPCLDSLDKRIIIYALDLMDDPRWVIFGPRAAAVGVRSLLALPLVANGTIGVLNLYGRYPHAFGAVDRAKALILATLAGLAYGVSHIHDEEARVLDTLSEALGSREVIGQAQGILMERERITGDQAFDILRRASQHLNIKLREVAQSLVDTGERPAGDPIRPK
jgi:GAF domain-containing protein